MDDSKLFPEFAKWILNLLSQRNWSDFEKGYIQSEIERRFRRCPNKEEKPDACRHFQRALMKITFIQTKEGGIFADIDALNNEERFATGDTDADGWLIGAPERVRAAKNAVALDLLKQGNVNAINSAQNAVRESMRKGVLDLSLGEMEIATSVTQRKRAEKPRPKTKSTLRSVVIRAMRTSRKNDEGLEAFLAAAKNGSVDGLKITETENEDRNGYNYAISYDNGIETLDEKNCTSSAINSWWTAAGKNRQ